MRFGLGVLLLLCGCERLFGLRSVADDAGHGADAARADGPADAAPDVPPVIDGASPLPMLVQQKTAQNTGMGLDVTLDQPPASGNTLILIGGATCDLSTVSGGGVNTWTKAASHVSSATVSVWYGTTAAFSNTVHLTPKCTTNVQTWGLLTEWSALPTPAVDAFATNGMMTTGSGTISLGVPTASAPDLLVLGASYYGTVGDPGTSWAELTMITDGSVMQRAWYQYVPTTGGYAINVPYSGDWDAVLVALHAP